MALALLRYARLATGLCVLACVGSASAQLAPGEDAASTLARADATKTAQHPAFIKTLARMHVDAAKLATGPREYLRFLEAWEVAYRGDYVAAVPQLEAVIAHSTDKTLRFRGLAVLINIFGIGHRYHEAYTNLATLVRMLPDVTDPQARMQGVGEASQMLTSAGQYDLAAVYAERMVRETPAGVSTCKGQAIKVHALYNGKRIDRADPRFAHAVAGCVAAGENLFANFVRADMADDAVQHGQFAEAIVLLEKNYTAVKRDQYPDLISQYEALLAKAYQRQGSMDAAEKYAHAAVASAVKGEHSEHLAMALFTLYEIARQRNDYRAAVGWLEQYREADKGYLNDVTARSLAYQVANQQVASSRLEADALDQQNRILQLQREVDRRAVESGRLYIALLLTVLVGIGVWLFRTKRAQLRFMRLSRQDSLTGICNRQHFIDESVQALRVARKHGRPGCLVLLDLDHFKLVNDTYGHAEGDQVLLRVVASCRLHLMKGDVFGRLGGEEFALFLPESTQQAGWQRAEAIRAAIAVEPPGWPVTANVTASFGVADTVYGGYELERLLVKADEALYLAKREGRDRIVVAHADIAATTNVMSA